jgi:hypothetical protein
MSVLHIERRSLKSFYSLILSLLLTLGANAASETLEGKVQNRTTNLPAVGDEVVLLTLGQGMEETGRTKTDAQGRFTLKLDSTSTPHLVRVIHQSVTYHHMAPPGTTSADVEVYDAAKTVTPLSVTADVMRLQAHGDILQGVRIFAVDNNSSPPRTQMNDRNFEFYLPPGAQIDTAMAKTAGGQPINSAPVPQKEKNRYAFVFPLRPGETQFQVAFHLPYKGEASIDPHALYAAQHFVVMLPKTMQFTAESGGGFQSMQDPRRSESAVQVVSNTQAGQSLAFRVSGTGTLIEGRDEGGGGQPASGGAGALDSRPGGGLGPPIDAPDPLDRYRWQILGGFTVLLASSAVYIARRRRTSAGSKLVAPYLEPLEISPKPKFVTAPRPALLLEALKEEMFQLEVEHKQGRLPQEEYATARAALDQTLERAVKRAARS